MTRRRRVLLVLAMPLLLLLLYVAVQVARGPVETVQRAETLRHPLAPGTATAPAGAPVADAAPEAASPAEPPPVVSATATVPAVVAAGRPLEVSIDLEEGEFEVVAGRPGDPIVIDASYDEANFSLTHGYAGRAEAGHRFEVVFRREVSMLRGLFRKETYVPPNRIKVRLPPDVPTALTLRLSKGQRDVDLTGLAVVRLDLEASQGQTNLDFRAPNPVVMEALRIHMSTGQLTARGLGHARAREVALRGSMGEMSLDFDGAPAGETSAVIRMSMGHVALDTPRDRGIAVAQARAFLGHVETPTESSGPDRLTLDLSVTFGAIEAR